MHYVGQLLRLLSKFVVNSSLFSDSHYQAGEHSSSTDVVHLLTTFPFRKTNTFFGSVLLCEN